MRAQTKLACLGSALPTIAILAHGCRGATQVKLELATHVVCNEMRGVEIVVGADVRATEERAALVQGGERFPSATTNACTEGVAPRPIGTLVITPYGNLGAVVVVAAFGKGTVERCKAPSFGPECIVARRRFTFVESRSLALPIVLDPICAGVPCNETSTCVGKRCVSSDVDCSGGVCGDPGVLPDGGIAPTVDGAPPFDAGPPPDGGSDSGPEAGPDGSDGGAGGGLCPDSLTCVSAGAAVGCNASGSEHCCYPSSGGTPACGVLPSNCLDMSGCCRGANDCAPVGGVCCADTPTPTALTRITCRPQGTCPGVEVCSQGDQGCGNRTCLVGATYSTTPEFFTCS